MIQLQVQSQLLSVWSFRCSPRVCVWVFRGSRVSFRCPNACRKVDRVCWSFYFIVSQIQGVLWVLWFHHETDQEKVLTEDEWMEWMYPFIFCNCFMVILSTQWTQHPLDPTGRDILLHAAEWISSHFYYFWLDTLILAVPISPERSLYFLWSSPAMK